MSLDDEDRALNAILHSHLADVMPLFRLPYFEAMFPARKPLVRYITKYFDTAGQLPSTTNCRRKYKDFLDKPKKPEPLVPLIEELKDQLIDSLCHQGAEDMKKAYGQDDIVSFLQHADDMSDKVRAVRAPMSAAAIDTDDYTSELLQQLNKNSKLLTKVVPTGFSPLDRELGGGARGGQLIVMSALINLGKTYTLCAIAENVRKNGQKSLVIPLEMTASAIVERSLCVRYELNADEYIKMEQPDTDTRSREDWYKDILEQRHKMEQADTCTGKVLVRDAGHEGVVTPRMIKSWAKETGADIIMIDAAQDIRPSDSRLPRVEGLYVAIAELNQIAVEMNIPIMMTVQLGGDVEKKGIKSGNLANIQWSQVFAQKAHCVFSMIGDRATNVRDVTTDKNRDGSVGRPWQIGMEFPFVKIEAFDLKAQGVQISEEDVFDNINDLSEMIFGGDNDFEKNGKPKKASKSVPKRTGPVEMTSEPVDSETEADPETDDPVDDAPETPYQKKRAENAAKRLKSKLKRRRASALSAPDVEGRPERPRPGSVIATTAVACGAGEVSLWSTKIPTRPASWRTPCSTGSGRPRNWSEESATVDCPS